MAMSMVRRLNRFNQGMNARDATSGTMNQYGTWMFTKPADTLQLKLLTDLLASEP